LSTKDRDAATPPVLTALALIPSVAGKCGHDDHKVDSMWMPSYESNQRSKKHNKSL
jgi:hypothetical protein